MRHNPLGSRHLGSEDALALQAVEVLSERAAPAHEIVALDEQHEERVDLIVAIENADQVSRVAVGGDGEEVAQRRLEELAQLCF